MDNKLLDKEIETNFIKKIRNIDRNLKEDVSYGVKNGLIKTIPLLLGLVGSIITLNPIFIGLGAGTTSIFVIKENIKETIKEYKNIKEIDMIDNDIKELEDTLNNKKNIKKHSNETNKLVNYSLNKNDIFNQIKNDISVYLTTYNLPPFIITEEQINLFLEITYNFFEIKNITDNYYESISSVIKNCFASTMLENKNEIFLIDLVKYLDNIKLSNINKKEILSLQNEIVNTKIEKEKTLLLK